ncbi:MAG: hypothetical protein ACRC42_04215 [Mycoplasma sp.]
MQSQLLNTSKQMPKKTMINAIVGISLALLMIIFNLVRTALTTQAFGIDSLGLLTIVVGILPYIATGHSGLSSVGTANLYNSVHLKDYARANKEISNLRPQYYSFGGFYLILTLIIAFSFPFIISGNGVIQVSGGGSEIQWYESTLFVLSNVVELFTSYFILPISVFLLFIAKKSYIANLFSIGFTIILNAIIFTIFGLVINGTIELSFIMMNVIIFCILGSKMIFVLGCLYYYRKKLFSWYKRVKPDSYWIQKDTIRAVGSQYLNQFGSDIIAILFMIYAMLHPIEGAENHSIDTFNSDIGLRHGGDGHGSGGGVSNFIPSAIYSTYLMLLVSGREIVHSIVDAAIPSIAEHTTYNKNTINKHMFHRYQVLTLFMMIFTASTYMFISGFAQSVYLHDTSSESISNNMNFYLLGLLWIPILIESLGDMYKHLLPIFKEFKLLFRVSLIKSITTTVLLACTTSALLMTLEGEILMNSIFIAIIGSAIVANSLIYFYLRSRILKLVSCDECVNITKSSLLASIWIIVSIVIMLPIYILLQENVNHLVDDIGIAGIAGICAGIAIVNFFVSLLFVRIFRKEDFLFYVGDMFKKTKEVKQLI